MAETPNTRIMKVLFSNRTKLRFTYLKPDFSNINDVYTNNITLWYFANSDHKKDNSEPDTDGFKNNIVNDWINDLSKLEYSKTTKGFELTETDFIKAEFKRFELFEVDKLNLAEKKQFDFYTDFLNKKLNSFEAGATDNIKNEHPKHDPNLWNTDSFELFKYLYDCYYKTTNRQLTNIWFFLKESNSSKYILKATKDQYKDFIFDNYQKKITNFDKAQAKWEDKEYNTINEHRMNFEDTLK